MIIYGWMCLGAAAYLGYVVLRPKWQNACGQLAGFLAYDLVLFVPFVLMLPNRSLRVAPEPRHLRHRLGRERRAGEAGRVGQRAQCSCTLA
jgi:hypothetical protein